MKAFKPPTFQERAQLAAKAKQAALERMRNRVPASKAEDSEGDATRIARDVAEAKRRETRRTQWEDERAARKARADERRELEEQIPVLTEVERKAARDARYTNRRGRPRDV